MSEAAAPSRRLPFRRWLLIALLVIAALATAAIWLLDTGIGHRLIADRIAALRPASGLRFEVGRIEGSIYGNAILIDVRVFDSRGLVFAAPRAELDWNPVAWFDNRLDITSLTIPQALLAKLPYTIRTGRRAPILPGFDIRIGRLEVERLVVTRAVTGTRRIGRISGRGDVRAGRAMVDLAAIVEGSDRLRLKLDAAPDRDRFDVELAAQGAATGILAKLTGLDRALALDIGGDGSWANWNGRARATAAGQPLADLTLGNRAGEYLLGGSVTPNALTRGALQRLTTPRILVNGNATFVNRRLDGALSLRSRAIAIDSEGMIDLANSRFVNLRTTARLLRPADLVANMIGDGVALKLLLDGGFETARFDYALSANRVQFDRTGFDLVRATGEGRLSRSPVLVPLRLSAARVTGVGDVAGGILRNLVVEGPLRVTGATITGDDLRLRSDKLVSRINLFVDLRTGRYDIGVNGQLGRYLIPGLGVVDVASRLQVVPGPGGRGIRVLGTGTATVLRLDNTFFRALAGGLPRIVTGLERGPDNILYFRNLRLTAPDISITGNGYRRRDGTLHFEGQGTQRQYGPLRIVLDGRIERPAIDIFLPRPNQSLGLSDVRARLDPSPRGYAYRAAGGSRLGPFTSNGEILLPRGGQAVIAIAALDVAGTRGRGDLTVVPGGFEGRLAVAGGGIDGSLAFAPVSGNQRIVIDLALRAARIAGATLTTIRRADIDATVLLDPDGNTVEATVTAAGIRRGGLSLARFAGNARLRNGQGAVRASIAGARGRAFDIQAVAQITPDRIAATAQGTIDRRPIRLTTPAIFTRDGSGWRLAPAALDFAGGTARIGGRFGGDSIALDTDVTRMPLAILDIGFPGLGLGGTASGKLAVAQSGGGAPTGRIDMTVRGLSRSGLLVSSRPIDLGIAGVLQPNSAAVRAVVASGGQTIGRAQARLSPLGQGGLATRLANAPLFAQLRYTGPADTLWRLTGTELFDLTGPVAIAADVGGTLADPAIRGSVRTERARLEGGATGTVLTNLATSGRFAGSRLTLDRFAADAGGGRVTGTGSFDLSSTRGLGIDLRVQADNAVLINRDDFGATVTGPLTITSAGRGGTIAGDVQLVRSRYRLGRATAAAALPRLNVREINRRGEEEEADAPPAPWRLAIRARAPDRLAVTGLGLDSEWSADLQIAGEPTNPAITGRADLVRGDYEFAGRDFELERGLIRFDGRVPADPTLDIVALADAQGLNATIRVTGTGLRPDIGFASVPALPEDELLSRLLFGTSITNLSAPEALQLAAAVAALQDGGTGLNPINAVRQAVGLDRLRILPGDPIAGQGTSIAAGKFITRRLYAEIITDGQGYSATQLEFRITRWLSLLSSISTIGRQSASVRVSRDY